MSETRFIDTTAGRLKVVTTGSGLPAVLWHSLFVDERSWHRVTGDLARDRRLVVITGPGHGESSDPGRHYGLLECAGAAAEVLDELGVSDRVDWVGNAWGGHVGVRFATSYPHRTRSLTTLGTPIQSLSVPERTQTRALLLAHRLVGPAGFIADAVVEAMLSPATRAGDPEAVALVRRSFVEAEPRRLRNAVVSISLQREDLASFLSDVSVPTLMVTGDQHGGWTPAQAAAAARRLAEGRVATVADAAYLVPLEQPGAVVGLLRDFWASTLTEASGDRR